MRSRTASDSLRTSRPSIQAAPRLSGKSPVSILMTVVFPLPLGPRKPKISPFSTRKLTSFTAVKLPKRRTRCSAAMAACGRDCWWVAMASAWGFQFHIRNHAGKDTTGGIMDANFYANDLVHAFFAGLNIARQEFGLLVDLFDEAVESSVQKGIDANFGFLAKLDAADFGFGNVDANVDLIFFEKRGDGGIRRDEVARTDVENLDDCGGGSGDLALAEAGFVVGVGCFGEVDVFATVAALEFFQIGLCLMVVSFGRGNFLGTVAALEFIELVPGALLLGDGDFPIGLGGIELLLRDEVFLGECVIAVKIEMRADFVSLRAIEIGLRGGNVFQAIAVLLQLVLGFGLSRDGAGFGDFFGTKAVPGFFCVRAGLLEGSLQFLVVKADQDLARLNGITFADQNLVDEAADFGTHTYVAGFDGAGALQGSVAAEPASVEPGRGQSSGGGEKNQDGLAAHETSLLT